MQIQSNSGTQDVSSPSYRLTGNVCPYKSPDSRIPDPSRTHYEALPGPKLILPNTSRAFTSAHPAGSWLERVLGLFDPALRDAEDMMLSLPYTAIREKTITLALVLDELSSSSMESPANRQFSGFGPYSKALASVAYSAKCLASRSLPAQEPDLSVITKAMCVIIAPVTVEMLIASSNTCYESLVAIITSYNRSRGHGTEMQARRALTATLAVMDKFVV
jgi:hypothetical protein